MPSLYFRINRIVNLPRDEICFKWTQNKCFEYRPNKEGKWFCGTRDQKKPHILMKRDWSPQSPTAFRFTMKASKRLLEQMEAARTERRQVPAWDLPLICDEELTEVCQILEFAEYRLVSNVCSRKWSIIKTNHLPSATEKLLYQQFVLLHSGWR